MLGRFIVYTNSQAFSLLVYLFASKSNGIIVNILLIPLVLFCENWLRLLLVCPCLEDNNNEKNGVKRKRTILKVILRTFGGLLTLPLILVVVVFIYLSALLLEDNTLDRNLLGTFVYNGIIIPFLLKLFLATIPFWHFVSPVHICICNITILKVNLWFEGKRSDSDMKESLSLTTEEQLIKEKKLKDLIHSQFDIFYCALFGCRLSGYDNDPHYNFDICQWGCYYRRCLTCLHAWYWEECDDDGDIDISMNVSTKSNSAGFTAVSIANNPEDSCDSTSSI
jgi:hypothetical protein